MLFNLGLFERNELGVTSGEQIVVVNYRPSLATYRTNRPKTCNSNRSWYVFI